MNLKLREGVARLMGWQLRDDGKLTEPEENNEGYGLYGYTPALPKNSTILATLREIDS